MRIVLVHPAPKIWTRATLVPLGLAYIAAYLEKNGFGDIKVVDYNVESEACLPKADVVGITATTPLIKSAWKIAKKAKTTGAVTIIGGPHVSALPEESIQKPEVDFVVVGEREETMLELCLVIEKRKKDFSKIKGLVFKKGRKIIYNSPRPFIKDLDSLPFPAYHFFKLPLYTSIQPLVSIRKPSASIMTSRGCPFNCNFCYKGTFGRVWRARGIEDVLREWKYLVQELKVEEIALMDDGFNIDVQRAITICQEIKKRGLVIPWRAHNGIRADRAPIKLLRAMKDSGCRLIGFGVESGCQRVLNSIGKDLDLKKVMRTFKNCRKLGILTMAFFMVGNLGENKKTMEKTIQFALDLDPDFAQFTNATPFPGTRLFKKIKKEGKFKVFDWDSYSQLSQRGYFDCCNVKAEEVTKLTRLAYRKFYLRPKIAWRLLKRKETWFNLPNVAAGAAHYLLQRDM